MTSAASRRSAVTVAAMPAAPTRTDSMRAWAGTAAPGVWTGAVGARRRASVPSGADPSDGRHPCRRASAAAGTPRAGTVTDASPLTNVAWVRRTGQATPRASASQRPGGASVSGVAKLGPGETMASSGTAAAAWSDALRSSVAR